MHSLNTRNSSGARTPENLPRANPASLQRAHSLSSSTSYSHARSSASVPSSSPRTQPTQTRKRLSLSFPILPANSNLSPRYVSPVASPAYSPSAPLVDISQLTPDDPMAFLTALAAQERRVLELKEELGKAETELGRLKRQWAVHEATKKLHDITPSSAERLRPLNTSIAAAGGEDRGILSPTREQYQARKATLSSLNGTSNRKVLPSQRHQRTLSLLATNNTNRDRDTYRQPFPQPAGLDEESGGLPPLVKRHTFASSTSSHSASSSVSSQSRPQRPQRPQSLIEPTTKRNSQDALIRTGKQMAEDFKEGLWTFIEDLRQATVGDEAINSSVNATGIRASPNGSISGMARSNSKSSTRSTSPASKAVKSHKEESLIDFGDSDNDTPNRSRTIEEDSLLAGSARWSTSSTILSSDSVVSPPTSRSSTPRTSTRFASLLLPLLPLALPAYLRRVFFRRIWTKSRALLLIMQFYNVKRALESIDDGGRDDPEEDGECADYEC